MERIEKMKQLKSKGLSYQAIGKLFNLSRSRVHQLISGYRSADNDDLKKAIFKRDDYKCQWGEACFGGIVSKDDLIVHHIDFDDTNNEMGNLITLCNKCHGKFHRENHIDPIIEEKLQYKEQFIKLFEIRDKTIIEFFIEKNLSMKDIAKIFNVSVSTIYQILKEAREAREKEFHDHLTYKANPDFKKLRNLIKEKK